MMNTKTRIASLLLALVLPAVAAAGAPDKMTPEALLTKHFKAVGGDKLKAAKTLKMVSTSYEGDKVSTVTVHRSRPNKMRYDVQKGDVTVTKLFDGTNGWYVEGAAEPKKVEEAKLAGMREKASFDDALFDHQKNGLKLALLGVGDANGARAYMLQVTRPNGDSEVRYIDQKSFLEVQRTMSFTWEGQKKEKVARFSDYRNVDGIMVNHVTEWESGDMKGKSVIQQVRYNVPVEDSVYQLGKGRS